MGEGRNPRRLGRIASGFAAWLLATTIILMVTEAGLRLAGVSFPYFYTYDPVLGHCLRPGAAGWYSGEGRSYVSINSAGQRDARDHTLDKPANTFRIAVLGDSYTDAWQLPQEQNFCSVLERLLPVETAFRTRKVEVLNFGVAGYGTVEELLMLETRVWRFHPDLILLAFYTGNDIQNNHRTLEGDPSRPYFVLDSSGQLVLDASFLHSDTYLKRRRYDRFFTLLNHCRVLQVIFQARNAAKARLSSGYRGYMGEEAQVYLPTPSRVWQEAWAVTEAMLVRMDREVRDHGARLVIATLSNPEQVLLDRKPLRTGDLFMPEKRMNEFGARDHLEVLNLAPSMQQYADSQGVYLHLNGWGHWNAAGHALAGALLARYLGAHPQ